MLKILSLTPESWAQYQEAILRLEAKAFSAAQCHSAAFYLNILNSDRNACYIAMIGDEMVGFLFSGHLELFSETAGVTDDPYYNQGIVLYTADMVVSPDHRNQGIGRALKNQQLIDAKGLDYRFVAGRNRLKYAAAMWRINAAMGAKEIQRLSGIYKDGREPNECIYHHLEL